MTRKGEGSRRENRMGEESKKEKTSGREGEESRGEKEEESWMRLKEKKLIIRPVA